MNLNIIPAMVLGFGFYFIGKIIAGKITSKRIKYLISILLFVLAIPGATYTLYYFHLIEEPLFYISFRSISYAEVLSCLIGLFLGFIHRPIQIIGRVDLFEIFSLIVIFFLTFIPFAKPIFRNLDRLPPLKNRWSSGVCLQSNFSTCGPSSLATIFAYYNEETSETELAKRVYTCTSGTESWYLIREAKRRGYQVNLYRKDSIEEVPVPSIVGVKVVNIGHFITLLEKKDEIFTIGDPLSGKKELSEKEFLKRYRFEKFTMHIIPK